MIQSCGTPSKILLVTFTKFC
ncbi:hypothetical protein [Paenisporosarcina sp. OV554]